MVKSNGREDSAVIVTNLNQAKSSHLALLFRGRKGLAYPVTTTMKSMMFQALRR